MTNINQLKKIEHIRKTREERAAREMREAKKAFESLKGHLDTVRVSLEHFQVWRKFQENGFYNEMGKATVTIADIEHYRLKLTQMVAQENEILVNLKKFDELVEKSEKKKTIQ